ncbi:MAG TPA: hypothetical protein VJ505_02430 [Holophagaceae bacterium]|nr:hypothetical protein [Holophagaceae bacterium]
MKASTGLIPLVGVGAVALSLALWARQAVAAQRAQAWGITRSVAQRLQTEEGARQLYRLNPELQARTPSVEAFLGEVRAHRAAFQALPALPPGEGYVCLPRLTSFTAQLKGADGTWLELEVQGPSLLDQARGEGLHRLHFASRREALDRASEAEASALNAAHWKRYQAVLAELDSPEGTRALWHREPGLHAAYPRPEDLVGWAQAQRPAWAGVPRGEWVLPVKVGFIRERGEDGESFTLDYPLEGRKLRMTWRNQQLTFLGFAPAEPG